MGCTNSKAPNGGASNAPPPKDERIECVMPPGPSGITFGKVKWGVGESTRFGHVVVLIQQTSAILSVVRAGDQIAEVDGIETLDFDQQQLGNLLMARNKQPRKITLLRDTVTPMNPPLDEIIEMAKKHAKNPKVTSYLKRLPRARGAGADGAGAGADRAARHASAAAASGRVRTRPVPAYSPPLPHEDEQKFDPAEEPPPPPPADEPAGIGLLCVFCGATNVSAPADRRRAARRRRAAFGGGDFHNLRGMRAFGAAGRVLVVDTLRAGGGAASTRSPATTSERHHIDRHHQRVERGEERVPRRSRYLARLFGVHLGQHLERAVVLEVHGQFGEREAAIPVEVERLEERRDAAPSSARDPSSSSRESLRARRRARAECRRRRPRRRARARAPPPSGVWPLPVLARARRRCRPSRAPWT